MASETGFPALRLQTKADKVPAGYKTLLEKDGHILAENSNVLPIAYGSTALMTESEYDKLSYPQTLDTITNRTIVPDSPDNSENASDLSAAFLPYASQMKEYSLPADFLDHKTSKKSETIRRELPETLPASTILLLSFDVKYNGEKDMSITINGIRNRLSGSEAPDKSR